MLLPVRDLSWTESILRVLAFAFHCDSQCAHKEPMPRDTAVMNSTTGNWSAHSFGSAPPPPPPRRMPPMCFCNLQNAAKYRKYMCPQNGGSYALFLDAFCNREGCLVSIRVSRKTWFSDWKLGFFFHIAVGRQPKCLSCRSTLHFCLYCFRYLCRQGNRRC